MAKTTVTQEEAQTLVRSWFNAVGSQDYQAAQGLTSGNATRATKQLSDSIQGEASKRNVQLSTEVRKLNLSPASQAQNGQAVRSDFDIQINVGVGPLSVPAQELKGGATFLVEKVNGVLRIIDIRDVTGLPS